MTGKMFTTSKNNQISINIIMKLYKDYNDIG